MDPSYPPSSSVTCQWGGSEKYKRSRVRYGSEDKSNPAGKGGRESEVKAAVGKQVLLGGRTEPVTFEEERKRRRADSGPSLHPTLRVPCNQALALPLHPPAGRQGAPGSSEPDSPSPASALSHPSGQSSVIVGSKGCTKGRPQDAPTVSIHSGPPGVLVASYAHFCSSNRCNRARSTSVLLNSLPRPGMESQGVGWDWGH